MRSRKFGFLVGIVLLLCSFTACLGREHQSERYQAVYMDVFDTVTTIVGYADSEEEFRLVAEAMHGELWEYHKLFDIYESYDGIVNLKTINEQAGKAPVEVDERLLRLLSDCKKYYELTDGTVNVAMGAVLELWHAAREEGREQPEHAGLPEMEKLQEAAKHCDMEDVRIDMETSSIYFQDKLLKLDVGAIAKGWAVEQVCQNAPEGYLINAGGNVRVTGTKASGKPWVIGIQAPEGSTSEYLDKVELRMGGVSTSGDYQRYYTVDGKKYHHLIDPETLMPGRRWTSVSIICEDSGLADALSTALFLMDREEGQRLLDKAAAQAIWVDFDGVIHYSGIDNT